jgi:hypothetical protein
VDNNGTIHHAVEEALLSMIQNCFDRDPEIAPSNSEETFGSLVERDGKYAKRVVFAVHQMYVPLLRTLYVKNSRLTIDFQVRYRVCARGRPSRRDGQEPSVEDLQCEESSGEPLPTLSRRRCNTRRD